MTVTGESSCNPSGHWRDPRLAALGGCDVTLPLQPLNDCAVRTWIRANPYVAFRLADLERAKRMEKRHVAEEIHLNRAITW